jgi:hypothetical protein
MLPRKTSPRFSHVASGRAPLVDVVSNGGIRRRAFLMKTENMLDHFVPAANPSHDQKQTRFLNKSNIMM